MKDVREIAPLAYLNSVAAQAQLTVLKSMFLTTPELKQQYTDLVSEEFARQLELLRPVLGDAVIDAWKAKDV